MDNNMGTFVASQTNPHTKRAYEADLKRWVLFLDGETESEELAIAFRNVLVDTMAVNSAIRIFNTIRGYYAWSKGFNPFERVKAPSRIMDWVPNVPDEEEVTTILETVSNDRDYAILALLNNGLRAQEVCDLGVEDFNYETIYDAWIMRVTGKGNKMRQVPANFDTVEAVLTILPKRGRIFPSLTPRGIYAIVHRWGVQAKVEGVHPHSFRHAYATRLARAEVSVISLQRLLGHARADTTALYTNLNIGDLVRESRKDPRNTRKETVNAVIE